MALSKSPQREEESILLGGVEVALSGSLTKLSEAAGGWQTQLATYVVQNSDTRFGILTFQKRDKTPTLLINQNLSQGPNGFSFVSLAGGVLP